MLIASDYMFDDQNQHCCRGFFSNIKYLCFLFVVFFYRITLNWHCNPHLMLKIAWRQPWKWRNVDLTAHSLPGRTQSAVTPAPQQTVRMANPTPNPTAQAKRSRPSTMTQGWPTGAVSRKWFITKWTSSVGKVSLSCANMRNAVVLSQ